MEALILIGGGGHAKSVIDSVEAEKHYKIVGIVDKTLPIGYTIFNIPVIGTDDSLEKFYAQGIQHAFLTIGSIETSQLREALYKKLKKIGYQIPNIIDPSAILSKHITLGEGNFIGKRAVLNSYVTLGSNCIINTGAIVEHDCHLADFVHLAPSSTLCGMVTVGSGSFIGAGTTIIQSVKIGRRVIIGAGSVVLTSIEDNTKTYGVPCSKGNADGG